MINTSKEYKEYISGSITSVKPRNFTAKATVTLKSGEVLNITEKDIVVGGLKIDDATSTSNSFQIGSAIINQCTLLLNNIDGKFSLYDFTDAVIRPQTGLKLSANTEFLAKGVFTVDEPTVASSVISLVALDNMNKFDVPFADVGILFPCTQLQLIQEVCVHCGVFLATNTFTNSNFIISRRPTAEAITCREIVSWIAQNSGNFARCNTAGALELKWYDLSVFEQVGTLDGGVFDEGSPYETGDIANGGDFTFAETENFDGGTFLQMDKYHHIFALNQATVGTDNVIITGINVKAQGIESDYGETVIFGTTGYVVEITNPLIQENTAGIIANSVGAKIVGMKFRPCTVSALADPSREAGDVAYLSYKNETFQMLISNVSYQFGTNDSISCDAETPSRNQSSKADATTKTIIEARRAVKKEINQYDIAVQHLTNLITNSFGVYKSEEIQDDGSIIYYMHNKPTKEASQTIWKMTADAFAVSTDGGTTWNAGFDAQGNAVVNVLNAIGINAEWIKVLTSFTVGNLFSVDSAGKLIANSLYSNNANITGGSFVVNSDASGMTVIRIKGPSTQGGNSITYIDQDGVLVNNSIRQSYTFVDGRGIYLYKDIDYETAHIGTQGGAEFSSLLVHGTKNRVVATKNYGDVLLNAYETPRPTFADTGHAQISNDGFCYIDVGLVFLETIDTVHDHTYFLTKYGQGDLWVRKDLSTKEYFVVEGTPNLEFSWKIEAVQRDYNTYNLEKFEGERHEIQEVDYADLAYEYLSKNEKEMISNE